MKTHSDSQPAWPPPRPRLRNVVQFLRVLTRTNLSAAFAARGAFWLSAAFMLANNCIFFTIWPLYFRRFESLGGWVLADVAAMYGVVAAAYGLVTVVAGGHRTLANAIAEGDLDPFLTQPKPVLPHLLGARCIPSGFGDLATGVIMLFVSGRSASPSGAALALLLVVLAAAIYLSANVLVHSLAFWLGEMQQTARTFSDYVVMFSMYPQTIYGGPLKALVFTLVPAGFIGWLPVETLREPTLLRVAALAGAATVWMGLAWGVFHAGLRRYSSGSRFGVRL
jgi:ABC-2 type transport system permease protein